MKLSELFNGAADIEITGLAMDSRKVQPGDAFFCLKGLTTDGHRFAGKAADAGAVAIVHSEPLAEEDRREGVEYILTGDVGGELNRCCDWFNGQPSRHMTVFGVTGTNGKSTSASIISDIYSAYKPCGYMGTIAVRYGNYSRVPNLTTPDQIEVHADLAEMRDHGMEAVAMEVSSHGLVEGRVDTVDFDCAIFTNISWDHLDYHKTMENYLEAKTQLFRMMKPAGVAVLNADDEGSIETLKKACACRQVTYGTGILSEADYMAVDVKLTHTYSEFTLRHGGKDYPVHTNLVALYNVYNLLGCIAAMHECGMAIEDMIPMLSNIPQVDGRMEIIDEGQDFGVIVDYAHTPDGFEKVFAFADAISGKGSATDGVEAGTPVSARGPEKGGGNVYAVFGSAGKRDKAKRPVLGRIAGEHCRHVYVTEEDPRNERPEDIAGEILAGVREAGCQGDYTADRIAAIYRAVLNARAGDLVLILGKGDETYSYYEHGREPYIGDNKAARWAIRRRLGTAEDLEFESDLDYKDIVEGLEN